MLPLEQGRNELLKQTSKQASNRDGKSGERGSFLIMIEAEIWRGGVSRLNGGFLLDGLPPVWRELRCARGDIRFEVDRHEPTGRRSISIRYLCEGWKDKV